jgi:uncharacterized protein (TIGR04551 family)
VKRSAFALLLAATAIASEARATGFTDYGQDFVPNSDAIVKLNGYYRLRADALYNLDLDRGPTPSGIPIFPVPLDNPKGQTLYREDMRLRTDLAIYAPGGGFAVKSRIDMLDNLALGSTPSGYPAGSSTQEPPKTALRLKRAYAEALTPFGLLAAGRMGSHWGLGMMANGGDCQDCNTGDSADRIAFVTPIAGLLWAAAYDFTSTGPNTKRWADGTAIDIEPSDNVHSATFAVMRWREELTRARRSAAGKATFDYGAYYSYRYQNKDIPVSYTPTAQPVELTPSQVMMRGYSAQAADLWLRVVFPYGRIEAEGAFMTAHIDQASLIPGVLMKEPVTSKQFGAALESDFGPRNMVASGGLDGGFASGDNAAGFGAFPPAQTGATKKGALDGAQANPPFDNTVNNFRFHPDYHIDRILFREIVGSVTDAVYVRPHGRVRLMQAGPSTVNLSLAVVASWAVYAASTPGGKNALGVEFDPTLMYRHRDGFAAAIDYGLLLPGAGFDNPTLNLKAKPAQVAKLRLLYQF